MVKSGLDIAVSFLSEAVHRVAGGQDLTTEMGPGCLHLKVDVGQWKVLSNALCCMVMDNGH